MPIIGLVLQEKRFQNQAFSRSVRNTRRQSSLEDDVSPRQSACLQCSSSDEGHPIHQQGEENTISRESFCLTDAESEDAESLPPSHTVHGGQLVTVTATVVTPT